MPIATKNQMELAHWVCERARQAGAAQARVGVDRGHQSGVEYRDQRLESMEESTTRGLDLTLFIDGQYSGHRTSDLRKEALGAFVDETVAMTRYLTRDAYRYLPEPEYYAGRSDADLELEDASYDGLQPADRHAIAKAIEAAALDAGGDGIISVTAGFSQRRSERVMVTTNGFEGYEERTTFACGAQATAQDEGDKRPADWWYEYHCRRGDLPDPAKLGRHVIGLTLAHVGAGKIDTESMPIVVDNRAATRLISFYRRALTGNNLQQKRSFLDGKLGEQVASEQVTVIDDPLIPRGRGSRHFDDEGIAGRAMPIIERGVLRHFYLDTYYGRKLGMKATTGSPSNVRFEADVVQSREAWMKQLGRGLLITGFLGGNSNPATGDFSAGVRGMLFENGEPTVPVAGLNLAGNHLTFWNKLIGIGDDPYVFSSTRTPTLVFEEHVVAGT